MEAIGSCSSRDKFFAYVSEIRDRNGNVIREASWKPLSEIDETNVMKAAYTNLLVNGITRLLGIRNLTWDDLKEFGIDKDKVAKVEYRSSKRTSRKKNSSTSPEKIQENTINTIKKYVEMYPSLQEVITTFLAQEKVNNIEDLSYKQGVGLMREILWAKQDIEKKKGEEDAGTDN